MIFSGGMPMEPERAILSQQNRRQRMLDAVSDDERVSLYCEALLADPRITMLQILDMQRPLEVALIYDPEKAIHTFHRCVIMGDSGAGKTTLLRHLAIMAAQRSIAGTPSLLP